MLQLIDNDGNVLNTGARIVSDTGVTYTFQRIVDSTHISAQVHGDGWHIHDCEIGIFPTLRLHLVPATE